MAVPVPFNSEISISLSNYCSPALALPVSLSPLPECRAPHLACLQRMVPRHSTSNDPDFVGVRALFIIF